MTQQNPHSPGHAGTYVTPCNLAQRLRVVGAETDTKMKKITFILSLVSLSLTVAASAAVQNNNRNEDGVYTLPAYNVSTPRLSAAEKAIETNLAELRAQARVAQPIRTELPSLGTVAKQAQPEKNRSVAVQTAPATQVRS